MTVRRRALPLRARLALTQGLLVAATLTFVVGLTVNLTHTYLTRELDARLLATVQEFAAGPARRMRSADELPARVRAWLATRAMAPDEVLAVRTRGGLVISAGGPFDLARVDGIAGILQATTPRWFIRDGPGVRVRLAAVPLLLDGVPVGTLVVATPKTRLRASLRALTWRIILPSALGLALALMVGSLAVRQSLRPLTQMLQQVEAIHSSRDLSRRIGAAGPPDEVGRLAAAFDRMLARVQEVFRAQQRFVADAAHELRTPLTVARGHLDLLAQAVGTADERRSVAVATQELDRMARIVSDLLLLARLDEGLLLAAAPVDVELVAREAVLRSVAAAPHGTEVAVEPGLSVLADHDRLLRVLTNLLTNAAVHGGDAVRITLRAWRDGDHGAICVADTGPGILPEDLPHVFERFYRGAAARRGTEGVGLGLAIAASLVKAMRGEITVRSVVGAGSEFTVRLPLASPPAAGPPDGHGAAVDAADDGTGVGGPESPGWAPLASRSSGQSSA